MDFYYKFNCLGSLICLICDSMCFMNFRFDSKPKVYKTRFILIWKISLWIVSNWSALTGSKHLLNLVFSSIPVTSLWIRNVCSHRKIHKIYFFFVKNQKFIKNDSFCEIVIGYDDFIVLLKELHRYSALSCIIDISPAGTNFRLGPFESLFGWIDFHSTSLSKMSREAV